VGWLLVCRWISLLVYRTARSTQKEMLIRAEVKAMLRAVD
jgi:hypothetical protein